MELILSQSAIEWIGLPISDDELIAWTQELHMMIEHAGSFGIKNWQASFHRRKTEKWIEDQIKRRYSTIPPMSPLGRLMKYKEHDKVLPCSVLAVEVLNLWRPIVAIAQYIRLAVIALIEFPELKAKLQMGSKEYVGAFVNEVRRYYPFFPFIGGINRNAFQWNGHIFQENTRFLLDIYGTNRDPDTWRDPESFRPERFLERKPSPFDVIPQGGGDYLEHHRCPGENTTLRLTQCVIQILTRDFQFDLIPGDYDLDISKFPARPHSSLVLTNIKPIPGKDGPSDAGQSAKRQMATEQAN